MSKDFRNSETKDNLMRAFAGKARPGTAIPLRPHRHVKTASMSLKQFLPLPQIRKKEHAEIFYNHLKELSGETIVVDGGYPVDIYPDVKQLLLSAQHNEYEEYDPIYKVFGDKAKEEGFDKVAASFHMISAIEKTHGDRFGKFAQLMEQNKLFISDVETGWICLNCGYVYTGTNAPEKCPVCDHDKGYFIRLSMSPFSE